MGIVLAELSLSDIPHQVAPISPALSPPLILLGLVLMSFPSDRPQLASWSNFLKNFGESMFPQQGELARLWGSIGCIMLVFGVLISPHARRLLSRRPLIWLGKVSFPIYLLHGTFMRSVMAWIEFIGQPVQPFEVQGGDGKTYQVNRYAQSGAFRTLVAIAICMSCTLVASHYWTKKVEPVFGKITKVAEDMMINKGGEGIHLNGNRAMLPMRKE